MKVLITSSFELESPAIGAQRSRALWEHLNSRSHDATLLGARNYGRPAFLDRVGLERLTEDAPGHATELTMGGLVASGHNPRRR